VDVVFTGQVQPGSGTAVWNPGPDVADGCYIVLLTAGDRRSAATLVLLR
jgi:hypothetical protein